MLTNRPETLPRTLPDDAQDAAGNATDKAQVLAQPVEDNIKGVSNDDFDINDLGDDDANDAVDDSGVFWVGGLI